MTGEQSRDEVLPPALNQVQLATWRTFLRAHSTVVSRLETELLLEQDLPLASYDVLVQLSEAPGRALRMTELADRVLLSRSGLTRLADRLEAEGLLRREACPDDKRGLLAVLTAAGLARLEAAWPVHVRGVTEHFAGRLLPAEIALLGALLDRIADGAS